MTFTIIPVIIIVISISSRRPIFDLFPTTSAPGVRAKVQSEHSQPICNNVYRNTNQSGIAPLAS